jgi:hypothetical protein
MPVAQNSRFSGRMQPVCINQRVSGGLDDLDILQLRGVQAGSHKLRGSLDVWNVLGKRADAGDAEEVLQLGEQPVLIGFNKRVRGEGHNLL